jgi:hypothetical protein
VTGGGRVESGAAPEPAAEGDIMRKCIVAFVVLVGLIAMAGSAVVSAADKKGAAGPATRPAAPAAVEDRVAQLEAKLDDALRRLEALQRRVNRLGDLPDIVPARPEADPALPAGAPQPVGASRPAGAKDPFAVGSTWSGARYYTQPGADRAKGQDWALTVLTRAGESFTGTIAYTSLDGAKQVIPVAGTAPRGGDGPVEFATTGNGVTQQQFSGSLAGRNVSLTFSGFGVAGTAVTGTARLAQ